MLPTGAMLPCYSLTNMSYFLLKHLMNHYTAGLCIEADSFDWKRHRNRKKDDSLADYSRRHSPAIILVPLTSRRGDLRLCSLVQFHSQFKQADHEQQLVNRIHRSRFKFNRTFAPIHTQPSPTIVTVASSWLLFVRRP